MIVISVGLQKSGSGLYFNLTNDLLIASGHQDVREIKSRYRLEDLLNHYNCNIGGLTKDNIERLLPIHHSGNSFVVKTHSGPTKYVKALMEKGEVKVTCIYRDPRDVVVSALEHGEKIRSEGQDHTFAICTSTENTIPMVRRWLDKSIMKWLEFDNMLVVTYEKLLENPIEELERLTRFLNVDIKYIDLKELYSKYNGEDLDDFQKDYLHFNKGVASRFRSVLTPTELRTCNDAFCNYLNKLGYPVE